MVTAVRFLLQAIPVTAGVESEERAHEDPHGGLAGSARWSSAHAWISLMIGGGARRASDAEARGPGLCPGGLRGLYAPCEYSPAPYFQAEEASPMGRIALVLLIAAILLCVAPDRGAAVGPDDGVWQMQQSNPTVGTVTFFASIHQNDGFLPSGFNCNSREAT